MAGEPARVSLRPGLVVAGLCALAFALVLLAARAAGPVDAATFALASSGAVLVFALARLFAVVRALARPDALAEVGRGVGHFSQAELREEKLRLLRAIKELEFDHGMGKLSTADFESVIATYRLRAIEVMRALEGGGELHPELRKLLAEREASATEAPATEAPATEATSPEATSAAPIAGSASPSAPATTSPATTSPEAASPAPAPLAPPDPEAPPASPPPASAEISSPDLDRTSRICSHCSGHNDNDARFCKHCGASLQRATAPRERRGGSARSGEIG